MKNSSKIQLKKKITNKKINNHIIIKKINNNCIKL